MVCQEDRGRLLRERLRLKVPTMVVPNSCFDCYQAIQSENRSFPHSRPHRVVFIYQGVNHLDRRYLCELVNAFGSVDADVLLRLALTGDPKNTAILRSLAVRTKHPEQLEFADYVPYPQHFAAAQRCHVGIMLYRQDVSLNYRYCAPNKLYEYAMLGLPVLSSDQDHLRAQIECNGFGLCVDPGDSQALVDAIIRMTNSETLREMGLRARRWYERFGRYEVAATRLEDWCVTLSARSTAS